jgi:hypothetical protein
VTAEAFARALDVRPDSGAADPVVQARQALEGVGRVVAVTPRAEIGD